MSISGRKKERSKRKPPKRRKIIYQCSLVITADGCWAVHWVTAAGFSSGTVSVYWGLPDLAAGSNLRFVFTSAGVWEPPRTSTLLQARDRMVFVAAGITGSVVISGQVTQMTARMLPRFLT